ncbi:MAG: patatin-like phospholipase family protein [Pseudobdellovibrionaceae bacterium]|nr:patatin-like phospholipase family protein [Pseudobdellovibrionaceae bacterium]
MIKEPKKKKLNLALQGGGAHGAFTWGVLDAILESKVFDIEGISATSAGSMNAVVMASGYLDSKEEGARAALENFWSDVSNASAAFCPASSGLAASFENLPQFFGGWGSDGLNSATHFLNLMSQNLSPYQFNPFNYNPLLDILKKQVDFDRIRENKDFELYVTATNVRTGDARIFKTDELTVDMVMASAALPNIFQAVKVGKDHFWDGGFVGNPSLWPLFYDTDICDILIVHVNPLMRKELPTDAPSIENRLNEITFNSALLKELRAISFVQKLLDRDMLKDEHKHKYKDILIHAIRAEDAMSNYDLSSKYDTSWAFLNKLKDQGHAAGKKWIKDNFENIGKVSTIDIAKDYLGQNAS